jgi:hypothetical protein
MLPAAQTKACREEVVKTSQTIKPTISFQDIFPATDQFSSLHSICVTHAVQLNPSFQRLYELKRRF